MNQISTFTISVLLCAISSTALAKDFSIFPPPKQVSPHVYAWIGPHGGPSPENKGFRMNLAFVVGKDSVAVLETGYHEPMAKEMLAHIAKITDRPVKYAINSNSQPDRYLGNESFRRRGALIIASEIEANRMAKTGGLVVEPTERALGLASGSIKAPNPPDRILKADTTLDLGGVTLHLKHFGAAHTPGPLVVHIPEDKVVYAGDILYSGRLLAVLPDGNVESWIQVFDKLKSFGDVTFVPGHGKPAKLKEFYFPTRDYLALLYNHMKKMVDDGVDVDEAIKRLDQSKFSKLENFDDLAGRNASWAYLEREKAFFGVK